MADESTSERPVFLSTLPPGPGERRLAGTVVLVSTLIFLAVVPFAQVPLAPVSAFIPMYESALVINDLITAVLLFGQFRILRSRALLILASGYLYTAFTTVVHLSTFPAAFTPTGLLAGLHTTAWLYMFWHAGFPLLVIVYALRKNVKDLVSPDRVRQAALLSIAAVLVATATVALLATAGHDLLPALMRPGNRYTPALNVVVSIILTCTLIALILLWRRRPHSVLDLWLMVVMCAWLFDIALSAGLNAARFDVGFYAGRIYGLAAGSFVLVVLLLENGRLYARLAAAHDNARRKAEELAAAYEELESFSYSVSHDLRAPLRTIDGFSRILSEDYADRLDAQAKDYFARIRNGCGRMAALIDDLLTLARAIRQELRWEPLDLGAVANDVAAQLAQTDRDRRVEFAIPEGVQVKGDPGLLRIVLENLLSNAWKFTQKTPNARIEMSVLQKDGKRMYCVRDNGAGFDMKYADKLFHAFQRLHDAAAFPGIGIGLATVQRIIRRHGGRVWAEGEVDRGAAFYFTLKETA